MKATTWQSKRQHEFQKWLELRTNYSKYRSISSKFHNYVTTEMLFHIPAITVRYFPIHGLYLPPHSDCAPHATAQNTASFSGGPQTKQDVTPGESSIVLKCGWLIFRCVLHVRCVYTVHVHLFGYLLCTSALYSQQLRHTPYHRSPLSNSPPLLPVSMFPCQCLSMVIKVKRASGQDYLGYTVKYSCVKE